MPNNMSIATKKRILIFSTAYYPFIAGAEVAVKEITDRLKADFEFDLITARMRKDLSPREKVGAVNVYRVGTGHETLDKLLLPFRGALLAMRLQNDRNYFCLWGMMVTFGTGAGYIFNILRFISGKKKVPMVLSLQEGDSENHLQYRWFGLIALSWKLALRRTDLLTGLSNFLLNRAKRNGYNGPSFLVPNGVDLAVFARKIDEKTRESLGKRIGKKPEDVFLVTTSRLTHKNAVDDIISSLVSLPINVHLIVIGKGDLGPRLQKQAHDLGVADRVKFLGFIPHTDFPKYFSVCDIFIRPSRSEGFGNSFIEAMAFGLPVIATPVGGIVDFIDDKETGVFCSPDNPQSISRAVKDLLGDVSLVARIVSNAKDRVLDRYGWDRISFIMKEVFDKVT